MTGIEKISCSRPTVEMGEAKAGPVDGKTVFLQMLKEKQEVSDDEPELTGENRTKNRAASRSAVWPGSRPQPADVLMLMASGQLLEGRNPAPVNPDTTVTPENPVTAAVPDRPQVPDSMELAETWEHPAAETEPQAVSGRPVRLDGGGARTAVGAGTAPPQVPGDKEQQAAEDKSADAAVRAAPRPAAGDGHLEKDLVRASKERRESQPEFKEPEDKPESPLAQQIASQIPADRTVMVNDRPDAVMVRTTPASLPVDIGHGIAAKMPEQDGILTIELEPASLGKLTIRVVYEEGRAAVSILSGHPETLELLSRRAGEIARILEQRTGQQTVVYTPEPNPQNQEQHRGGRGHSDRGQERERDNRPPQPDSFVQQLRLGLL